MLDLTSYQAALKTLYSAEAVKRLTYSKDPLALMIAKTTNFVGENKKVSVIYGNGGGRSATFSNANTRGKASSSKVAAFFVVRVKDYGVCKIDAETIEASASDAGALIEATKTEFDSVLDNLALSQTSALYRDKSGAIGQIKTNMAGGTDYIDLKNADDIVNYQVDQSVVIYSAKTGGTQRLFKTGVSSALITKIDRDIGRIYFATGTVDTGVTGVANDYLFTEGDRGLKLSGLASWLPRVAPTTGDSFFGLDRSTDPVRLAGVRYNATGMPIEEALNGCVSRLHREGAAPTHCILPYAKYTELQNSLSSKVNYVNIASKDVVGISFTGIKLNTPKAAITVVPSAFTEADTGFMLTLPTWKLSTLGENIKLLNQDGNKMLRSTDDDAYEARFGYYGNLECSAPGWNANIQLA